MNFDLVYVKVVGKEFEVMLVELVVLFLSEFEDSELGFIFKGWLVIIFGECLVYIIGGDWGKDVFDEKYM